MGFWNGNIAGLSQIQRQRTQRVEAMQDRVQAHFANSLMDISNRIGHPSSQLDEFGNVASNIVIRYTRVSVDQPTAISGSAIPVEIAMELHMPQFTDIRAGDTVTVKSIDSNNNIVAAYRGVVAADWVNDGRRRHMMSFSALGREDIRDSVTPPPYAPAKPPEMAHSTIIIKYLDLDTYDALRPLKRVVAPLNEVFQIEALTINGFDFSHSELNGAEINIDTIEFTPISEDYTIAFFYTRATTPQYLRLFSTLQYSTSVGLPAVGAHWWGRIWFRYEGMENDIMTVSIPASELSAAGGIEHPTNRQLIQLRQGTRARIFPQDDFWEILQIELHGNEWIAELLRVEPTAQEQTATLTIWYDWD